MNNNKVNWNVIKGKPQPLGITMCPQGVNFAVEVKDGQSVELVLLQKKTEIESIINLGHIDLMGEILAFIVEDLDLEEYDYYYRVDGRKQLCPYAKAIEPRKVRTFGGWDIISNTPDKKKSKEANQELPMQLRCGYVQDEFDWQEDVSPKLPLNEVILYCAHLRGFTKHNSSKVKHKGTFQGLIEKIPYLKELGINQIELMPVYEFKEVIADEEMLHPQYLLEGEHKCVNYWGYSKENYYYAVKQTYAASQNAETELKTLVRELHKNGIELILEFYFQKECRVSFVVDCLTYWVLQYHVDGFHITGEWTGVQELLKEPLFADKKIYGVEVYNVGYLTNMRSFLKSDSGKVMDAAYYIRRNDATTGVINFFTSHDGFTMMDMVSYDSKHNEANQEGSQDGWEYNYSWNCGEEGKTKKKKVIELRKRQLKNAWTMLMLSQGIPAILAGDELCNSQNGNNNVYCQDNEIGWVNWKTPKAYEELYTFVRQLIQLRKEHPIFHLQEELTMTDRLENGYPDLSYHSDQVWYMDPYRFSHSIGMLYCGDYAKKADGSSDDYFYVAYNMGWNKQKFAIPDLPKARGWYKLLDTSVEESICAESEMLKQRIMEVPARTIIVLIGKKIKVKQGNGSKSKKATK